MKRAVLAIVLAACARSDNKTTVAQATHDSGSQRPASRVPSSRTCGISLRPNLTDQGIGELTVGRPVTELSALCHILRDTTELGSEATPERNLTVDLTRDTVVATVDSENVWRIEVDHPVFRTSDSLGVGTILSRLLPVPGVHGVEGEGGLYLLLPAHCGLSFHLKHDVATREHRQEWSAVDLRRLPPATPIDEVLVVGCTRSRI